MFPSFGQQFTYSLKPKVRHLLYTPPPKKTPIILRKFTQTPLPFRPIKKIPPSFTGSLRTCSHWVSLKSVRANFFTSMLLTTMRVRSPAPYLYHLDFLIHSEKRHLGFECFFELKVKLTKSTRNSSPSLNQPNCHSVSL